MQNETGTSEQTRAVVLANLVMDTMELHENSYRYQDALDSIRKHVALMADPKNMYSFMGHEPHEYYIYSMEEAAHIVCNKVDPLLAYPVYLLCQTAYNDIQSWVLEVAGRKFVRTEASLQFQRDTVVAFGLPPEAATAEPTGWPSSMTEVDGDLKEPPSEYDCVDCEEGSGLTAPTPKCPG